MHLTQGVLSGHAIPPTLPRALAPTPSPLATLPDISMTEKEAYRNVFNKISQDQINAMQGRQLLQESQLSPEELSLVWDLADVNRDGCLDGEEWGIACHLVRHLKHGGKLEGPVNVFQWLPERISPISYQAKKHRVEEYNTKKHELMTAKDKRKKQIDNETQRLDLLKRRFALHKELFECLKTSGGATIPEEEFILYKDREQNNIDKVEAIIFRLKKEHEVARQATVKAILGEQGSLKEDARLSKLEQDEVRRCLAIPHTHATKDPDPFHQLYELRRDQRKRSTLSESEEPEVHFPFVFNPFNPDTGQLRLTGHSIFISPDPSVLNNNNSHRDIPVLKELYHFAEGFLERWSSSGTDKSGSDYDPIFMALNVPLDTGSWMGMGWSEGEGLDSGVISLHKKLVDLKLEMEKLNEDSGGQLLFRNPDDYLAKQKAQAEEEKLEKSKYQRRFHSDKRADGDREYKRRSYIPTSSDDNSRASREARSKRHSLNLDKRSDNSDRSSGIPVAPGRTGREKGTKSTNRPLSVTTDNQESFSPESASSPRSNNTQESKSPRSPISPTQRPSTKRKIAPPPPCLQQAQSAPTVVDITPVILPQSKIPKAVQQTIIVDTEKEVNETKPEQIENIQASLAKTEPTTETPKQTPVTPNRPPRRKKKSEENRSFLHDIVHSKDNNEQDNIAATVNIENIVSVESTVEDNVPSAVENEDSLLDAVIKELPSFKSEIPVQEESVAVKTITFQETVPEHEKKTIESVDSQDDSEIRPVKINKSRGKIVESDLLSKIQFQDREITEKSAIDIDSDIEEDVVISKTNKRKVSMGDAPDGLVEEITTVTITKTADDDLQQAFDKILTFPNKDRLKDNKDTISISSDISSTGSDAPPLPDSAPPPLPTFAPPKSLSSGPEELNGEMAEVLVESIEPVRSEVVETAPEHTDSVPEITVKASPREVVSPIDDLKAEMFSMRVTSPTRQLDGDVHLNGALEIDVGHRDTDSVLSDDERQSLGRGSFTPGQRETSYVPTETNHDDGGIQLISYNGKLNSPTSDQSGPDSAFEDMQSSMTSNDPLSNTMEEIVNEDYVSVEKVVKTESVPPKKDTPNQFVLEFDDAKPKGGPVTSPTGSKDFMAKAQMFADTVQKPPKMTVRRKKEITTPDELSDERYIQLEAERQAVISSSTMKKRAISVTSANDDSPTVHSPTPDPESSIQEWRSDVSKRSSISWDDKPEKVNLYSDNIIQESENTDAVDRESIANLSSIRQQWETKLKTGEKPVQSQSKAKQSQPVRHWEVKLPTQLRKVPADVIRTTKTDSDSESENMADTDMSNESAIEREIRLATEREELLRKEKEEQAKLHARQMASSKKEPFENEVPEQNNNKPTYHEMTEADRGSELQQRENKIQRELLEQQEREEALRSSNTRMVDSSQSSGDEDDNANESIIEREIRLQRERELEIQRERLASTNIKASEDIDDDDDDEEEEIVETFEIPAYQPPVRASPTPVDVVSDTEEQMEERPGIRARISYEDAISTAAHEGESLIARELREAREREDELRAQRERSSLGVPSTPTSGSNVSSPRVQEPVVKTTAESPSVNYQKDVSPFKHERKQSSDSLSSGHSSEKPQTISTPRTSSSNVRSPFGNGGKIGGLNYHVPEKPKEAKQRQETPIEREIRLARERENDFRISKGLAPLKDEKKVDYELDDDDKAMIVQKPYNPKPSTGKDNVKKFASNRLQKEINQQAELEKKYLDEGKIKSTSEEHVGLLKYQEITQDNNAPSKRNFSITKKGQEPVSESSQNGTPDLKQSPNNATPEQTTPKYGRSKSSSGGVTFSYRESRHKAESKIEQELREMREREEELRSQRSIGGVVSPASPRSPTSTSVVNKRSHFEQTS
ncbi:uncharacterized protein LOC128215553 isoform X2 [Mya arenaria]|nr:uncharacterized protein LOC128215553 isoform X2 [Mya arenaria]